MKWLALLALVACRGHEESAPPPAHDAARAKPADAAEAPVDAPPPKPVAVEIAVGDHASCAVMTDATLRCWGANGDGQLGDGTRTDHASPVTPSLRGVKHVVFGTAHACALLDDGSVACWGKIKFGKKEAALAPSAVPGVNDAKRVFSLGAAACAGMADGKLVCWGDVDVKGHLRLSGGTPEQRVPTPVVGLDHVAALTVNGALHEDGTVSFWGADGVPVRTALAKVVELASAGDAVCGLLGDGTTSCAGSRLHCAAGKPAKPAKAPKAKPKAARAASKKGKPAKPVAPVRPELPIEVLQLPRASHLAFDVGLCAVTKAEQLQCLDARDGCKLDQPWPLAKVAAVSGHCARITDGTARCWEVESKSRTVRTIAGVTGATQLVSSGSHACAVVTGGAVVCWGDDRHGALGRGTTDGAAHPEAASVAL